MAVYLITLSLLIAAVLLIRVFFRRTLSPRFTYALWLAVVIKLCLPIPLFEIALPALPDVSYTETVQTEQTSPPASVIPESSAVNEAPVTPSVTPLVPSTGQTPIVTPITPTVPPVTAAPPVTDAPVSEPVIETEAPADIPEAPVPTRTNPIPWGRIAAVIWIAGSAILALWFILSGCMFRYRLYADRQMYRMIRKTKVYVTSAPGVPCLAGLIPSIYITPEAAADKSKTLIMIHEYTHLRHGDHIWSFVRMLALIVHWWNPLVWAAAILSKQDAELACDDAISAKLDDGKRFEYAHILLDTIPQKQHSYAVALGTAPMKERILMLTQKHKNRWICAVLAAILTVAAVGCSFMGVKDPAAVDAVTSVFVSEAEALPGTPNDAILHTSAVGGNPVYYIFDESLTYYRHDLTAGTVREYEILLPEDYTGGRIYYASAGAGSGEMRFVIETEKAGEPVYLDCYFSADYGTKPAGNLVLLHDEILSETEALQLAVTNSMQSSYYLFTRGDADYIDSWFTQLQDYYAGRGKSGGSWESLPDGATVPATFLPDDSTVYDYTPDRQTPVVLRFDAGEWWLYTGFTLLDIGTRADFSEMLWHLSEAWFIPKTDWVQEYDAQIDKYKFYFETTEIGGSLRYTGVKYHHYITGESFRISNIENLEPFRLTSNGAGLVLMEAWSHPFFVLDLTGGAYYSLSTNRLPYFVYTPENPAFAAYGAYVAKSARWLDGTHLYAENESGGFTLTFENNTHTFTQGVLMDEGSVIPFLPAGTMQKVDGLPAAADRAINEAQAFGGNPKIYQFDRGLTYYVHNLHDAAVYKCTLPMPAGCSDGQIIDMTTGGGSGEILITVKVKKNGAVISYQYLLDCSRSYCTPVSVYYPYNPTKEFGTGPFLGYVTDAETPWIDLYTEKEGVRVGQIPYEIFHDWIATDRTSPSWTAGWMGDYICFYYGEFHEYRWAAVHLADTVMGSGRKNVAVSDDGGQTWNYGSVSDDYGGNHVTGIGFASETTAFMSFHYSYEHAPDDGDPINGPVISWTVDRGKTWQRLEIKVPAQLKDYQMNGLSPVFEGKSGIYPIQLYQNGQKDAVIYLVTSDGGMTWDWQTMAGDASLPRWRDDEYLVPIASFGEGGGVYAYTYYSAAEEAYITKLRPGTGGVSYAVFERRNKYDEADPYRGTVTYRIVTKGGSVWETEEVPTPDVEKIKKDAVPYNGSMLGTHSAKIADNDRLYTCTFTFNEGGRAELTITEENSDYSETLYGNYDLTRSTGKLIMGLTSKETKYGHTIYASVWSYSDGENDYIVLFPETSAVTGLSPDAPFPLIFTAKPADTNIREYDIDIPLNEDNREYITSAASYGEKPGISYGDKIGIGEEGTRYEVFGVGSHFKKGGKFSAYKTYRITTSGGYLTEIEETETFTKDVVRKNGKPLGEVHEGQYSAIAYCMGNGPMSYVVYLRDGGKISAGAGLTGTDAGGTGEGTYTYDPKTGTFTAELVIRTASEGEVRFSEPQKVSGKLYEYGGFVHFLCEESDVFAITPDDPLPVTFLSGADGSQMPDEVKLDSEFDGEWYYTFSDESGDQFYYLYFDTATAEMRFYYGYYESEFVNRYTGTYMVNPLTRLISVTLHDPSVLHSDPYLLLRFHLGYSVTAVDGGFEKRLLFSPEECSAQKYQHLVGKDLFFTPQAEMPIYSEQDVPSLQYYQMTFDDAAVTLTLPGAWYWDGANFVEKATQPGPYEEVKRVDVNPTSQNIVEFEQSLWQAKPSYDRKAIMGRTDQGLYFTGYTRDYSEVKDQPSRWYRFFITGLYGYDGAFTVGIRRDLTQDGEDFLENTVIPILESIRVDAKTEPKPASSTPGGPCAVHGPDYHAYPYDLIKYVGTDVFSAWTEQHNNSTSGVDGCPYGSNFYRFLHDLHIPREVLEEYYLSSLRYWGHDYPVDLLYSENEAAVSDFYAYHNGREGFYNQKDSFERIRFELLDYAENSDDPAYRQFYEQHVVDSMIQEWSVADFVRATGIGKEELRALINGFKKVEYPHQTLFLNCFVFDYDTLYQIAATPEKTTAIEKLTEDLRFGGLPQMIIDDPSYLPAEVAGSQDPTPAVPDAKFDGDWYHSFSDDSGKQFYYLHFDTASSKMRFYYGYYESEYANCYVGSYTVNPQTRLITASLADLNTGKTDPTISLSFHLGSDGGDGSSVTQLTFSPKECSVQKYQHLVGKNYTFVREPLSPVKIPTEASGFGAIEEEILFAYKTAGEAASWFRGTCILWENESVDAENAVVHGELNYRYYKADKFETYAAFRKYLEGLFSVDYVNGLLSSIAFIEHDGMLYAMMADRGSNPRMGAETYTVLRESDTKYILRVTVELLEGGYPPEVVGYETFDFPYEYIDNKWVFTDFPKIR